MSIELKALLAIVPDRDLLDEMRRRGIDLDRLGDKPCAWCGAFFPPNRGQKFCSAAHRKEAGAARRKVPAQAEKRYRQTVGWMADNRETYNAYHRWYQKRYRERMTDEQKARYRAQKRAWYARKAAAKRAPSEVAA